MGERGFTGRGSAEGGPAEGGRIRRGPAESRLAEGGPAEGGFVEGRKYAPEDLGRVLVLGLGKSGRAAIDYLLPLLGTRVRQLAVAAGASAAADGEARAFVERLRAHGVRAEFDHERIEGAYDLCIASPGIPQTSAFYASAAAASAEVVSEVEFAWRESAEDARWVAITGTNGKTTTVALTAHLLRACGMAAKAVGNIGDTCIKAVAAGGVQVYVAEVSSYQLASTRLFAPDVAVVLNVTPDHLAWHGGFEAYAQAKLKVLANLPQVPGSVAVLDATDDEVRKTVRALRAQGAAERGFSYVPVGTAAGIAGDMRAACGSENAACLAPGGMLVVALGGREHALLPAADLRIKGEHNVANALAAAAAALAVGGAPADVARALSTFQPLEHRLEPCGSVAGVECYNDSKATNVDATLKAFAAFGETRPIVLLGGRDKGTDLAPLVQVAQDHAKAVVCFGEAGERFAEAFLGSAGLPAGGPADAAAACDTPSSPSKPSSRTEVRVLGLSDESGAPQAASLTGEDRRADECSALPVLRAERLEDALDAALSVAGAGDVVLLSPACASFDEFSSFEERGRAFKALVAARAAAAGGRG